MDPRIKCEMALLFSPDRCRRARGGGLQRPRAHSGRGCDCCTFFLALVQTLEAERSAWRVGEEEDEEAQDARESEAEMRSFLAYAREVCARSGCWRLSRSDADLRAMYADMCASLIHFAEFAEHRIDMEHVRRSVRRLLCLPRAPHGKGAGSPDAHGWWHLCAPPRAA
jgi:hypothetical protein